MTRLRLRSDRLLLLLPVLLIVVITLPRVLDAHFGVFDDPVMLLTSEQVLDGGWSPGNEAERGRFHPLTWLYYAAFYALFGPEPAPFFWGNALLLALIALSVIKVAAHFTNRFVIQLAAALLLITSGPIVENLYTLMKFELLQTLWIVLSLLAAGTGWRFRGRLSKAIPVLLVALAVLFASMSKETSPVLLPISFGWLGMALVRRWKQGSTYDEELNFRIVYFIGAGVGVAAYFILRGVYVPYGLFAQGQPNDFSFELDHLVANALEWRNLLVRDYFYMLFLLPLPIINWVRKGFRNFGNYLDIGLWLCGWLGIFIPWKFVLEYYLLPFEIGTALLAALLLEENFRFLISERSAFIKALGGAVLVLGGLFFLSTFPNNYSNARLQLTVDRMNAEMIDELAEDLPVGSRLIINIDWRNEYVDNIGIWLTELRGRDDLSITHYTPSLDEDIRNAPGDLYLLAPVLENWFYPSVRMGFNEFSVREWNANLQKSFPGRQSLIHEYVGSYRLLNIDAPRLFCPFVSGWPYCEVPNTPFDQRVLSYGWRVYSLEQR